MNPSRNANERPKIEAPEINSRIKASEVRIVDTDFVKNDVYPIATALQLADDAGLDLVLTNGSVTPPLCRIVDYGKYRYELTQREKQKQKAARENQVEVKEIKLRPVTDTNDIIIKAKRAKGFLEDGDKVKITVQFRGREMAHQSIGTSIITSFCDNVGPDVYKIDAPMSMNGRQMTMVLGPIKRVKEG